MARHQHATMDETMTSDQARGYDRMTRFFAGAYGRIARDARRDVAPQSLVVDIGAGPGRLIVSLARQRPDLRIVGVDPSQAMVDRAETNLARFPTASARLGTAEALPFANNSVDVVVSSFALHHWTDPEAAGREIDRILKPGGAVRVYDMPHGDFEALRRGLSPRSPLPTTRFALTPLGWPSLRVLATQPAARTP